MNKFFFLLFLVLCSCKQKAHFVKEVLKRPKGIPETTCDGTPIEWTWKKQRAYEDGRLFFARKPSGCVIAVIIKLK